MLEADMKVTLSLGDPLPPDYHAVSVNLPEWNHVLGYEKGDAHVINSMKIGYPRFRFHNEVNLLMDILRIQRYFEQHPLPQISAKTPLTENSSFSKEYPDSHLRYQQIIFLDGAGFSYDGIPVEEKLVSAAGATILMRVLSLTRMSLRAKMM